MPKPRILVIDDDPMITQLLQEHLSEEGYDVKTVHLAEEGYQYAIKNLPDLIFLDVMLPDATGFQTVARFRKDPITSTTPIIMMSGTARNANQLEIAKGMGATEYVLKPFDIIKVGEQVGQLIKNKPLAKKQPEPAFGQEPMLSSMSEPEPVPEPVIHERLIQNVEALPPEPLQPSYGGDIELIPMHELLPRETEMPQPEPSVPTPYISPIEIQSETPQDSLPDFILPSSEIPPETSTARHPSSLWMMAPILLVLHVILSIFAAEKDVMHAATYTAGGWALLLGCFVAVCAMLQISIDAREALIIEGWASIPIILRGIIRISGLGLPLPKMPDPVLWMRPLDLFELASILVLGISVRKLPGSSLTKSVIASGLITLAWCLTARGYFHPF